MCESCYRAARKRGDFGSEVMATACPHSDRRAYVRGLCGRCYDADRQRQARADYRERHGIKPFGGPPTCGHPDRPHLARGMCASCYSKAKRRGLVGSRTPAECHPDRIAYAVGLCASCYEVQKQASRKRRFTDEQWERFRVGARRRAARYELRQFGLTEADYEALVQRQGGVCAICGRPPREKATRLHVDHDHESGAVRGLLCGPCNRGIGMLDEDPAILEAALAYLKG